MLVLGNVNTHTNHHDTSGMFISMLVPQDTLLL